MASNNMIIIGIILFGIIYMYVYSRQYLVREGFASASDAAVAAAKKKEEEAARKKKADDNMRKGCVEIGTKNMRMGYLPDGGEDYKSWKGGNPYRYCSTRCIYNDPKVLSPFICHTDTEFCKKAKCNQDPNFYKK